MIKQISYKFTKGLALILVLIPFASFGQMTYDETVSLANNGTEQEILFESSNLLNENYLYLCEVLVDKLLEISPESCNYNYRKGYVLVASKMNYVDAIPYLEKAVKNTSKNYDLYSPKEKNASVDAIYLLAYAYHLNYELDKAEEYYTMFLEKSGKSSVNIEKSKNGILQCKVARKLMAEKNNITVKNVGTAINTKEAEYSPVVSLDGKSLYFTSRRAWPDNSSDIYRDKKLNNYPEDVYVSYVDFDNTWTNPVKLEFCENNFNEATIAVSSDEKRVYVYKDNTGGGDIYYSEINDDLFENIDYLERKGVNTKNWETHCTIAPDGRTMYFVSDRPGGFGGRDIYSMRKINDSTWTKPQNMGSTINTEFDEESPFVSIDNKMLYFSSNGPNSMGGFDIFISKKDSDGNWMTPETMGYPVNGTGDDLFYTTSFDGITGYFTSQRKDGFGDKDIYEVNNPSLKISPFSTLAGNIISMNNTDLPNDLKLVVSCTNCEGDELKVNEPRLKVNGYFQVLDRCRDYTLEFYQGDYLIEKRNISTLCDNKSESIEENFYIADYTLAGTVSDEKTLDLLANSTIEFLDPNSKEVIATYTTNDKGSFVSNLLEGKHFGENIKWDVRISSEEYLNRVFNIDITLGKGTHIQLDYLLNKIEEGLEVGAVIALNPIYFDLNKSNIRPDAAEELDKIVQIMNDNPDLEIEIGSHTDCRASKKYNLSLSNRRAKSTAKYIQSRITKPKRLSGKGYGESQLVNDCGCEGDVVSDCSEEEHQANRRTEFKVKE